jgi:Arc/MetJ-type ribon-helix-helix transcriptional regulator
VKIASSRYPIGLLKKVREVVKAGLYPNQSELMRYAARDLATRLLYQELFFGAQFTEAPEEEEEEKKPLKKTISSWLAPEIREKLETITSSARFKSMSELLREGIRLVVEEHLPGEVTLPQAKFEEDLNQTPKQVTCLYPRYLLEQIKILVRAGYFENRSEFLRTAVQQRIERDFEEHRLFFNLFETAGGIK